VTLITSGERRRPSLKCLGIYGYHGRACYLSIISAGSGLLENVRHSLRIRGLTGMTLAIPAYHVSAPNQTAYLTCVYVVRVQRLRSLTLRIFVRLLTIYSVSDICFQRCDVLGKLAGARNWNRNSRWRILTLEI
jgi:hypothetical protein